MRRQPTNSAVSAPNGKSGFKRVSQYSTRGVGCAEMKSAALQMEGRHAKKAKVDQNFFDTIEPCFECNWRLEIALGGKSEYRYFIYTACFMQ